jgi:hypothetical protein
VRRHPSLGAVPRIDVRRICKNIHRSAYVESSTHDFILSGECGQSHYSRKRRRKRTNAKQ